MFYASKYQENIECSALPFAKLKWFEKKVLFGQADFVTF